MGNNPFIHKFEADKKQYVYDVNTNRILGADRIEYDLVDDFQRLPRDELVKKWKDQYDAEQIDRALDAFDEMKSLGYLSSQRPKAFVPADLDHIKEQIETKRRQLLFNVTERCNLRCKYCAYSGTYCYERTHSHRTMPLETAKKAIRSLYEQSSKSESVYLSFYGGEPLLAFDVVRGAIEYAKRFDNWPRLTKHIDTNGTLLNREIIRYFIDNDVSLQISLDGPKEIHDQYRVYKNGRGSFNRIIQNIRLIREMDPAYFQRRVTFSLTLVKTYDVQKINEFFSGPDFFGNHISIATLDPYDTVFFEKYIKKSADKGFSNTYFSQYRDYVVRRIDGGEPTSLERALYEKGLVDLCRRGFSPMGDTVNLNGVCIPGVRRTFVDVEGNYHPCERAIGEQFKLGHVDTGVDPALVKNLVEKYARISSEKCFTCWAVRICKLCFSMARKGETIDAGRKSLHCATHREELHSALRVYIAMLNRNKDVFKFVQDMVFE